MKGKGQLDSLATANPILVFNSCMASKSDSSLFFSPHWKSRGAERAPVNEMLVISIAHCLPPSPTTALLCIREELSVSLVLKEGNATDSAKFHEGLPWPRSSNRPGWESLIMWDLICKKRWLKIKWRFDVPGSPSQVVLGLRALFYLFPKLMDQGAVMKITPPVISYGKFYKKGSQPEKF